MLLCRRAMASKVKRISSRARSGGVVISARRAVAPSKKAPRGRSRTRAPEAKPRPAPIDPLTKIQRLADQLVATQHLLHHRTVLLTGICDSPAWLAYRVLGAVRRMATDPGTASVRDRELNEIVDVVTFLTKPGTVFGYEHRGWNLIRALGAARRMIAKGIGKGGWESERAELEAAVRRLIAR